MDRKLRLAYFNGRHNLRDSSSQALDLADGHTATIHAKNAFSSLPRHVYERILSYLDYQSLILLFGTHRFFLRTVQPSQASHDEKVLFLLRAENYFQKHRPTADHPGNFACFFCYRILSPSCFARTEHGVTGGRENVLSLRRFCIKCGLAYGFHSAMTSFMTKLEESVWICDCLNLQHDLRCTDCRTSAPRPGQISWMRQLESRFKR